MGSATTQALAATTSALNTATVDDLSIARELFVAARTLGESLQLSGALSAWGVPGQARAKVAEQVFAALQPTARSLVTAAVAERWSSTSDLISGIEELAIRAAALGAPRVDVEQELFEVSRVVADNPDLELALGSRLGDAAAKGALVARILDGRASEATTLIVSELSSSRGSGACARCCHGRSDWSLTSAAAPSRACTWRSRWMPRSSSVCARVCRSATAATWR